MCVLIPVKYFVWLHIWFLCKQQTTTTYLVQASVPPSFFCQNAPRCSLARDEGHMLIQLRAGSPVLPHRFSLSASIYLSSPLIRFLFAFLSLSRVHTVTLSWQHWQHFCSQILLHGRSKAPVKTSFLLPIALKTAKTLSLTNCTSWWPACSISAQGYTNENIYSNYIHSSVNYGHGHAACSCECNFWITVI